MSSSNTTTHKTTHSQAEIDNLATRIVDLIETLCSVDDDAQRNTAAQAMEGVAMLLNHIAEMHDGVTVVKVQR